MNNIFSSYDAWLVGVALAALMLAAWRIGWQIGQRERQGGAERTASKFDDAIVDFYTCASMLKEPVRTQLQMVIRDYAALRFKVARQPFDRSLFEDALRQ